MSDVASLNVCVCKSPRRFRWKDILVYFLRLTQWPTYRPYHCTQRRQSGPVWKWAGGAGAFTRNESETEKSYCLRSSHYLYTVGSVWIIPIKVGSGVGWGGAFRMVNRLCVMAPKPQKTASSWWWQWQRLRFVRLTSKGALQRILIISTTVYSSFVSP